MRTVLCRVQSKAAHCERLFDRLLMNSWLQTQQAELVTPSLSVRQDVKMRSGKIACMHEACDPHNAPSIDTDTGLVYKFTDGTSGI